MNDPKVNAILLDIDSPGGMVAGAFDLADVIYQARDIKPVWSVANDLAASAGQLLAATASHQMVTQTSVTGSIGVMSMHTDISRMLSEWGYDLTLMYSGIHKVDRTAYRALSEEDKASWQIELDNIRGMFAEKISEFTGLSTNYVLDTEGAIYRGKEAVSIGLADYVVNGANTVGFMINALNESPERNEDSFMSVQTQSNANTVSTPVDMQAATSVRECLG